MIYCAFDTETTGLPNKYASKGDPKQPHIVQLAAQLYSADHKEMASLNLIIKPNGWESDAGAIAAHGITTEIGNAFGVSERWAVALFLAMARNADVLVAHNLAFDRQLVEIAFARFDIPESGSLFTSKKLFCTAEASSPIVNLPPTQRMIAAGINKPKTPKLIEAHEFFFGEGFDGAHDALNDVRACQRVYKHLVGMSERPAPISDYRS